MTIMTTAMRSCMWTISAARTAVSVVTVTTRRFRRDGQGSESRWWCGIQAHIANSQRTAGQTRSVLSGKDDICGTESAGENDASAAEKKTVSAYEARLSRPLHRQAVSDQALHWCDIGMDTR